MTPQQALEVLKDNLDMYHPDNTTAQALTIAIEAMEAMGKVKKTCEIELSMWERSTHDYYKGSTSLAKQILKLTKTEIR